MSRDIPHHRLSPPHKLGRIGQEVPITALGQGQHWSVDGEQLYSAFLFLEFYSSLSLFFSLSFLLSYFTLFQMSINIYFKYSIIHFSTHGFYVRCKKRNSEQADARYLVVIWGYTKTLVLAVRAVFLIVYSLELICFIFVDFCMVSPQLYKLA